MVNIYNFSMTLRRFKTCLQYYKTSRPLLDLREMLMTGCLLDVVVTLMFGQMHFISLRQNPPFTPFIIVYDGVLGFIFLSVCYILKLSSVKSHNNICTYNISPLKSEQIKPSEI